VNGSALLAIVCFIVPHARTAAGLPGILLAWNGVARPMPTASERIVVGGFSEASEALLSTLL
jgi:hypothetical protein